MAAVKHLMARCPHCGGHVTFPATDAGLATICPHCSVEFELLPILETAVDSDAPAKGLVWAIVGIVLMLLALGIAVVGLMYFQSKKENSARRGVVPAQELALPALIVR
jgi:uncharacterized paraquat-inducible protein A